MGENEKLSPKNQNRNFPLDRRRRGRQGILPAEYAEILGRAEHFQYILRETTRAPGADEPESLWEKVRDPLLNAKTEEDVTQVFEQERYGRDFVPWLSRPILKAISDSRFPKTSQAQIHFLADSIAAAGRVSPRRSRNICEAARLSGSTPPKRNRYSERRPQT